VSDAAAPSAGARGKTEVVEPTDAQRAFARRVAESKATAPHVYFERALEGAPVEPASLIAACGAALRELPLLNGGYRDGRFELYSRVNVGFGVEAGGTLVFPVIHDADGKDEVTIGEELEALSGRAASGEITSPELAGATFTVIAMPDAESFTPVINRGQAATLGAGSARLTLACDNRIVQGNEGAELLRYVGSQLDGKAPAGTSPG
jgi:pyruvate dehydrogenase E2 component (dihydrolipoamide acetyltransferase)